MSDFRLKPIEDCILIEKMDTKFNPIDCKATMVKMFDGTNQFNGWGKVIDMGRGTIVPGLGLVKPEIKIGDHVKYVKDRILEEYRKDGKTYLEIPYKAVLSYLFDQEVITRRAKIQKVIDKVVTKFSGLIVKLMIYKKCPKDAE